MLENENNTENNSGEARIYEVGFLLVPTISEEDIIISHNNLKSLLVKEGGNILTDEMPKIVNLAYEMVKVVQNVKNKFNIAYFGWIKFEINIEKILELKKKLDIDPLILRFLILKTVKENTIASRKLGYRDIYRRKSNLHKKENENQNIEINKEEIDKEIDALVAV